MFAIRCRVPGALRLSLPRGFLCVQFGETALHFACMGGHYFVVRLLVMNRINVNVRGKYGTALDVAMKNKKPNKDSRIDYCKVLQCLVEAGADTGKHDVSSVV